MKNILKFFIMPVTKRIRAYQARKFIKDVEDESLLDIGCGDKYLLKSLKKIKRMGIDKKWDGPAEDMLPGYQPESFDYITMLAVIEHFDKPWLIMGMCCEILKPGGRLVLTTPLKKSEGLINLYLPNHGHNVYFTKNDFEDLDGLTLVHYSTFEFGLNQLVVLERNKEGV